MAQDEEAPLVGSRDSAWTTFSEDPPLESRNASLIIRFMEKLRQNKRITLLAVTIAVSVVLFFCFLQVSREPYLNLPAPEVSSALESAEMSKSSEALVLGRVIGDVIDSITSPSVDLKVQYTTRKVTNGALLKPSETAACPKVEVAGNVNLDLFTLVMVDPDAPSPSEPSAREWLHWMVVDVPGASTVPTAGTVVTEYNGPTPPIGIHRYVFVLYKQKAPVHVDPPATRRNFSTRLFAKQYDLGVPVAAVYFNAQKEGAGGQRRR